jgi:hypothetical protein
MKYLTVIMTILLLSCNHNQKTENKDKTDRPIQQETSDNNTLSIDVKAARLFGHKNQDRLFDVEDTLVLKTTENSFQITPQGLLRINEVDSIHLKTEMLIETAYLYEDKDNYYVFFTETDMDVATSYIQKITRNNLKSLYVKMIYGFNLGQPIISQDFAYVNTLGCVGKIDLSTGEYIWQHKDLYDNEKYSFNSFDTVLINRNTTEFISENYKSKKIDKVIIDNETWEILTIDK